MTVSEEPAISGHDPLLHEIELPLQATYDPLGFRLELATNSPHVIEAADEAWGGYTPESPELPLHIRMVVQPEGGLVDEPPVFRGQGSLFSMVCDRHNFGVYDRDSLSGYCFVSARTAANPLRLRMHFLEAMTYALLAQRHGVPMHAASVMRNGSGILLCGHSGAGKSTLSFACARAGWTLVSDDATWLPAHRMDRVAIGKPWHVRFRPDAPRLFPELARYTANRRPNGKLTLEAATADFPQIRTSVHCPVEHMVLLDRRPGARGRRVSIPASDVFDRILLDGAAYGASVREMHERALRRLSPVSAWRLEYETLEQALELLAEIA